jgi:hypothetical protein
LHGKIYCDRQIHELYRRIKYFRKGRDGWEIDVGGKRAGIATSVSGYVYFVVKTHAHLKRPATATTLTTNHFSFVQYVLCNASDVSGGPAEIAGGFDGRTASSMLQATNMLSLVEGPSNFAMKQEHEGFRAGSDRSSSYLVFFLFRLG